MKIKVDHISNSSSTSFVYISQGALTKQSFFKAAGISEESPLASLFSSMFEELKHGIDSGETIHTEEGVEALRNQFAFTSDVLERMKTEIRLGNKVVTNSFSSESNLAEMILCTEIFEIESTDFYINAYNSYW